MSIWTHVNGNIRYDYIPFDSDDQTEKFKQEIKKIFGEMIEYDHVGIFGATKLDECPDSHIPCGSEGNIEYAIYPVSRGFNVGIYGDLRNYDEEDSKEIIEWFEKILSHKFDCNFITRDAVLNIYTERKTPTVLVMDGSDDGYQIIKADSYTI